MWIKQVSDAIDSRVNIHTTYGQMMASHVNWFLEITNFDGLSFIGFYRCLYSLVKYRYTRLLEGAVQTKTVGKNVN